MGNRRKSNHRHPNRTCGDGEVLNLKSSLIRAEAAFRASAVADEKAKSASKEAVRHFENISKVNPSKVTALMSKVERLNEKLEHCDSDDKALRYNVELQKLFDERQVLEEEVTEAEANATACQVEAKEETAARKACEKVLANAKNAYSEHFLGKLSTLGVPIDELDSFEVVLATDGQTFVRRSSQNTNGLYVLFRENGSVDEATVKSCLEFFHREKPSTQDFAAD